MPAATLRLVKVADQSKVKPFTEGQLELASRSLVYSTVAHVLDFEKVDPMKSLHGYPSSVRTDEDSGSVVELCILCTCDLHMALRDYDYFDDAPSQTGALSRLAPLIDRMRRAHGCTLLFDAGDILQGDPTGDLLAADFAAGHRRPHPMIQAMNEIGYDAAIAGNHDLNFGLGFAKHAFDQAKFPLVLSHGPLRDKLDFLPSAILERQIQDHLGTTMTLRIGVLGILPPGILAKSDVDGDCLESARLIETQIQDQVETLRANGADLVIALSHSGANDTKGTAFVDATVVPLVQMSGIDAIICGHTHQVFPKVDQTLGRTAHAMSGLVQGKPVVQAGYRGAHLGHILVTLKKTGSTWQRVGAKVDILSVQSTTGPTAEAPRILELSDDVHARTLTALRQTVGRIAHPMHDYFADLGHDNCGALIGQAKIEFAKSRSEVLGLSGIPVLALTSSFRPGRRESPHFIEIERGPILARHICAMYPFPNRLNLVKLNRDQVFQIANATAQKFNSILPDVVDQKLTNESVPAYEIETLRGLTCTLDLSRSCESRITKMDLHCQNETEHPEFVVAISDFRTTALGLEPFIVDQADITVPDLVHRYLSAQAEVSLQAAPGWVFAPIEGASVKLRTGIGARRFLSDIAHYRPKDLGTDENGFLWLRADLSSKM